MTAQATWTLLDAFQLADGVGYYPAPSIPFVFQPEAFMNAELLEPDVVDLRCKWCERFPNSELERLVAAMGHSFD